jgi:hypothetical protein
MGVINRSILFGGKQREENKGECERRRKKKGKLKFK